MPDDRGKLEAGGGPSSLPELAAAIWDEQRQFSTGERPTAEEYLRRFPQLEDDSEVAIDVIYGEFLLRKELGEPVTEDGFLRRFPRYAAKLARQFQLFDAVDATSFAASRGWDDTEPADGVSRDDTFDLSRPATVELPTEGDQPRKLGRYRVQEIIGVGGFAVVYKAADDELHRVVAIKTPRRGQAARADDIDRYQREAQLLARLDHPAIVPVYDVGRLDDGRCFVVSKFIDGRDLAEQIRDVRPSIGESIRIVREIADALQHAHECGMLHRDVKPANILLDQTRAALITDFGLAISEESTGPGTQIVGTPAYMSPEQTQGDDSLITAASDVYSLGVVLYELLAGRPPFIARRLPHLVHQINFDPPPALPPAVSPDVRRICLQAISKDPAKRHESAAHFAADLRHWEARNALSARRQRLRRAVMATFMLAAFGGTALSYLYLRAHALLDRLLVADATEAPAAADQLSQQQIWIERRLRTEFERAPNGSTRKRNAGLGLTHFDASAVDYLTDRLLRAEPGEFAILVKAIDDHRSIAEPQLWRTLDNPEHDRRERFRAGMALASYAPRSNRWRGEHWELVVDELLQSNSDDQRDQLTSARKSLTPTLESRFGDEQREDRVRESAANALSDFLTRDPARLAHLATTGNARQFQILYERIKRAKSLNSAIEEWARLVTEQPWRSDEQERIAGGRTRAAAACGLVRAGNLDAAQFVFDEDGDLESLTQFTHGAKERGVAAAELLDWLDQSTSVSARYCLLLTLGDYNLDEVPSASRSRIVERVAQWYASDPDSGIHSACGWLLRRWEQHDIVERVEQTPIAFDPTGERTWFVLNVGELHFTFIVCAPGRFEMGSPPEEQYHEVDELRHPVKITRRFAICDREVTRQQYETWSRSISRPWPDVSSFSPTERHPTCGNDWFETAFFCSWLTEIGMSARDQCYSEWSELELVSEGKPKTWPVDVSRAGFRLPTEAEWEFACRGASMTPYSFGSDHDLLDHYAAHPDNSPNNQTHIAGATRPNLRGLFDMHGNVFEWCLDSKTDFTGDREVDPLFTGSAERVMKGGSYTAGGRGGCRSASRTSLQWDGRGKFLGFRIAVTLPPAGEP